MWGIWQVTQAGSSERQPRSKVRADCKARVPRLHPTTCVPACEETVHTADRELLPIASGVHGPVSGASPRQPQGPMPPKLVLLLPHVPRKRRWRDSGVAGDSETCPVFCHYISEEKKISATSCLIKSSIFGKGFIMTSNNSLHKQNYLGLRFSNSVVSGLLHSLKNYWESQNFNMGCSYQCIPE